MKRFELCHSNAYRSVSIRTCMQRRRRPELRASKDVAKRSRSHTLSVVPAQAGRRIAHDANSDSGLSWQVTLSPLPSGVMGSSLRGNDAL